MIHRIFLLKSHFFVVSVLSISDVSIQCYLKFVLCIITNIFIVSFDIDYRLEIIIIVLSVIRK